jgi:Tol biopolymer transport system component/DNA-binding winged helix-turn-helix (wHTH) protein
VSSDNTSRIVRFGVFEVDLKSGELRRSGLKVKLQEQPFQVLTALLEHPGEVVTREELRERLWPADTFVAFDHGLNAAIKRLRDALGEPAETPVFVETVARRGYRFIGPVVRDSRIPSDGYPGSPTRVSDAPFLPPPSTAVQGAEFRPKLVHRKTWKTAAAVLVAVIAFAGIFVWLGRPLAPPKLLNTKQITRDGVPKQDVILTDGSRLYFMETNGARTLLAQVSVSGGDSSIIPTTFTNIAVTDISPDRSQLLARNFIGTEHEAQLWTLPLAAGNPTPLSNIIGHSAVWSRDGQQLAFAKGSDIYLANADGTSPRKLITVTGTAHWIRFSPDGKRLRFTEALQDDSPSIWEVGVNGLDHHRVFKDENDHSSECCGAWSADGRYYLFVRNVSGRLFIRSISGRRDDIWAVREAAGWFHRAPMTPFQLTTGPMSLGPPLPSPDGRRVFTEGVQSRGELVRYENRSRQFAPFLSGISAGELDFSRDGKWVAYVSYPDRTLWRTRMDGSEQQRLTYQPVAAFLPRWSPDGNQIAYVDLQSGRPWKIFLISAQGGTPQALLAGNETFSDPNWSPDGNRICFGRSPYANATTKRIEVLDLKSKQISAIPGSENLYSPRWSPDGKYLLGLSADSKKLLLYDFKTQKWTDWITEPGAIGFPTWSRDGKFVYYDNTSTEKSAFFRAKIGHTRPEVLIDLKGMRRYGKYGWAWSGLAPDDSALLVRDVSTDEIYALDLELP